LTWVRAHSIRCSRKHAVLCVACGFFFLLFLFLWFVGSHGPLSAREAGICTSPVRPGGGSAVPHVVFDSEYSDLESTTTASANRPSAAPSSAVTTAPSCQPSLTSTTSSSRTATVDPGRSRRPARQPRDNRRRPADSCWDSPPSRRRSPPRHGSGGHHQHSTPSGRSSPPTVDLHVSQAEYAEFRRFQSRQSRD